MGNLFKRNNKWALRLGTLIIGKIALIRKDLVLDLLYMLLLIMRNKNWEIQQAISWCLNNMAGVTTEPFDEITENFKLYIVKKKLLN